MSALGGVKMKKVLTFALAVFVLAACAPAVPQSAKDAYLALKKIEGKTQAGVNYMQYMEAVGDAMGLVNVFIESKEAGKFPELAKALKNTVDAYLAASLIWKVKVSGRLLSVEELAGIRNRLMEIDPAYKQIETGQDAGEKLRRLKEYHAHLEGTINNAADHDELLRLAWKNASIALGSVGALLEG
jgi:hypothetical protein